MRIIAPSFLAAVLLGSITIPLSYAGYPEYPQCYQDCQKWGIKLLGHTPSDATCFNQCAIDCNNGHQGCIKLCHTIKKEHAMLWLVNCTSGCKKACVAVD